MRAIEGSRITVENSYGNQMYVSRDILEQMYSATHYAKDVAMTMTTLAEQLESAGDTVISVQFRKKPNEA